MAPRRAASLFASEAARRELVQDYMSACSAAQRRELADRHGITVAQLYNLASRWR